MSLQHDIHRPTVDAVDAVVQIRRDELRHWMRSWLLWWAVTAIGLCFVWLQPVHAASTLLLTPTTTGTPAALSLSAQLQVADADRRQMGQIFVLAVLPNNSQFALSNLGWTAVGNAAPFPYLQGELGTHTLDVLSGVNVSALAGTVLYGGYGTSFSDMLKRQLFGVIYTIPGSVSGPATAGDWLTFSLNVQDFSYPDRSAATVEKIIGLHEQYRVPVDIYLTDTSLFLFETQFPSLITRLRTSPYVALNYHIRPPKPYYTGYDWASVSSKSSSEQQRIIHNYETHLTDLSTGQPSAQTGGFARLRELTGNVPTIAAFQTDAALYDSVSQVFKDLGAVMTISHSLPYINLGTQAQGLYIRPEHYDLKLFESVGQTASALIEAAFSKARATNGARHPYVVGVKMHDNDFFAQASAWTTIYVNGPRKPNWNISTQAALKSDADQQAQWTIYEAAVAYADSQRQRFGVMNALGMGSTLAAAPKTPLLYISGTMHIESSKLKWPQADALLAFFQRATAVGKLGAQTTGMRWSIGADVGWLNGEPRAAELIKTLSAQGVEWDIHAHSATDRVIAAQKIIALGGTPNTVVSGATIAELESLRTALKGSNGYTWQASSLYGLVRNPTHTGGSEDMSNGLWLPRSSADWQAHDPSQSLVLIGGGSRTLTAAENMANSIGQGGFTSPVYSATIMVDPVNFKVMDGISSQATTDGIEQIEAFAKRLGGLPHVRWASLSGTAQAWRNAGRVPSRVTNTQ